MATREDWAVAYYRQGRSDWTMFTDLQSRADVPACHALHFLQMATEKLAKAYRFRDTSADAAELLTSHVGFPRFLNAFLLSPQLREEYDGRHAQLESIRKDFAPLARAIEQLAPAVDRASAPGNAEYPWERGEDVVAPIAPLRHIGWPPRGGGAQPTRATAAARAMRPLTAQNGTPPPAP